MAVQTKIAQDPVCGMQVDESTAAERSRFEGRDYYFCCAGCRTRFEQNPKAYTQRGASEPTGGPGHQLVSISAKPELQHDPVCGMDIQVENAAGSVEHAGKRYYFCSQSCLNRFKATPDAFLEAQRAGSCCRRARRRVYVPHGPGGSTNRTGDLPEVRHGFGADHLPTAGNPHRIHLPDASRDRARRAGCVSDLRNGAGAAGG